MNIEATQVEVIGCGSKTLDTSRNLITLLELVINEATQVNVLFSVSDTLDTSRSNRPPRVS